MTLDLDAAMAEFIDQQTKAHDIDFSKPVTVEQLRAFFDIRGFSRVKISGLVQVGETSLSKYFSRGDCPDYVKERLIHLARMIQEGSC